MVKSLVTYLFLALLSLVAAAAPASAQDDVAAASRGVVRVVVVQVEDGEIVDFGHGSGFAVAPNRIVTNAHVVELALADPENVVIGVVPSEGSQSYGARIIAADRSRDLALLEIQQGSLPPVALFTGAVGPGASVAALGYPGNVDLATAQSMQDYIRPLPPTRSSGNYSDLRRGDIGPIIVHTAAIARGHSGGPLVDACGRVIGVNRMITRNDQGDSSFAFAIPVASVVAFLREARQPFRSVDAACVSAADQARAESEREEEARRAREADEATRLRDADARHERALGELQQQRENRTGIAIGLLVLAVAGLGAGGILLFKDKHRPALIAGGVGVAFLLGSAIVFFTRPGLESLEEEGRVTSSVTPDPDRYVGTNICTLDRQRSRVTVSGEPEVELAWEKGGCVNNGTQYARYGDVWRRVLVPNSEQTVSVTEFNPASGDYVVNRYLLSASAMDEARQLRRRVEQRSCTRNQEDLAILADRQRDLEESLPDHPNERLVYRCSPENGGR